MSKMTSSIQVVCVAKVVWACAMNVSGLTEFVIGAPLLSQMAECSPHPVLEHLTAQANGFSTMCTSEHTHTPAQVSTCCNHPNVSNMCWSTDMSGS